MADHLRARAAFVALGLASVVMGTALLILTW